MFRILSSTCPCVLVLYGVGFNLIPNAETRDHAHQLRRSSQSRSNSRPSMQGPITWTWQGEPQRWTVKVIVEDKLLTSEAVLAGLSPLYILCTYGTKQKSIMNGFLDTDFYGLLGLMTPWRSVPKILFFSRHMGLLYEIAMVEYSISNAYTSDDINWIHRNTLNLCHMTLLIRMYSVFLPMWNMKSEIVNSTSTMHASWWFLFWKLPYLAFLLWHSILYLNWGLAQFRRANLKCMSTLMFHHTPKTLNCVFTQTHTHIYIDWLNLYSQQLIMTIYAASNYIGRPVKFKEQ